MENQEQECIALSLLTEESENKSGWSLLGNTLTEDVIYYRFGPPPMHRHGVAVLSTPANITWWKGLELLKIPTNTIIRDAYTQDENHGPNEFEIGLTSFDRSTEYTLYLCKAKEFGIHRRMYYIPGDVFLFNTLEIFWAKD